MPRPYRPNIPLRLSHPDVPQLDDRLAEMCNRPKNSLQERVASRAISRLATIIKRHPALYRDVPPPEWTVPVVDRSSIDLDLFRQDCG
jgi:hypothetical protein